MKLLFHSKECTKRCTILLFLGIITFSAIAQTAPTIGGVVRARYEIQTTNGRSRFAIRNSRIWIKGSLMPKLSYFVSTDDSLFLMRYMLDYTTHKITKNIIVLWIYYFLEL